MVSNVAVAVAVVVHNFNFFFNKISFARMFNKVWPIKTKQVKKRTQNYKENHYKMIEINEETRANRKEKMMWERKIDKSVFSAIDAFMVAFHIYLFILV